MREVLTVGALKDFLDWYIETESKDSKDDVMNRRVLLVDDGMIPTYYRGEFCMGTSHSRLMNDETKEIPKYELEDVLGIVFNVTDPEK